jgi:PleD family two-component response regulator
VLVHGRELPVALAMGWQSYQPGDQMCDLIERADRMLYLNKGTAKKQDQPALNPVEAGL